MLEKTTFEVKYDAWSYFVRAYSFDGAIRLWRKHQAEVEEMDPAEIPEWPDEVRVHHHSIMVPEENEAK